MYSEVFSPYPKRVPRKEKATVFDLGEELVQGRAEKPWFSLMKEMQRRTEREVEQKTGICAKEVLWYPLRHCIF